MVVQLMTPVMVELMTEADRRARCLELADVDLDPSSGNLVHRLCRHNTLSTTYSTL